MERRLERGIRGIVDFFCWDVLDVEVDRVLVGVLFLWLWSGLEGAGGSF